MDVGVITGVGEGRRALGAANLVGVGPTGVAVLVAEGTVARACAVGVGVGVEFRRGVGGIVANAVGARSPASGVLVGLGDPVPPSPPEHAITKLKIATNVPVIKWWRVTRARDILESRLLVVLANRAQCCDSKRWLRKTEQWG